MIENRSLLFIPAKEKMLNKIKELNSDVYILDLEDSIENDDKESALNRVIDFLENNNFSNIIVRINCNNFLKELKILDKYSVGFMLPKFEYGNQYEEVNDILLNHKVIALVESPLGIINLSEIASKDYIDAIAFGAEDYTAKVNMKNDMKYLYYQKSKIINVSKAFSKKVFDTPSFKINDEIEFQKEVNESVDMGFDGKLLIHPKHIDYINKAFGQVDIEYYKKIINTYENSNEAVIVIDGIVYEKMHINRMKKILKEKGE